VGQRYNGVKARGAFIRYLDSQTIGQLLDVQVNRRMKAAIPALAPRLMAR
jgi:hypothetical protein